MKITATSREEILRRREEYDAETKRYDDQYNSEHQQYEDTIYTQKKAVESLVSEAIGSTFLDLTIQADPWSLTREKGWAIRVEAWRNSHFDDKVALSWNWEVKLSKDGDIVKDSGSWSGLKAITPEQIADLEESVRILKILNGMDWETIVRSPMAKWDDFISEDNLEIRRERSKNRPDFESELKALALEDLIGTDTAIELTGDEYYRGNVCILPTGLTDKFIKGYIFPQYYLGKYTADEIREATNERRTSKNKIRFDDDGPVTVEVKKEA